MRAALLKDSLVKFAILREVNENGEEGSRRYSSRIVVTDIGDIFQVANVLVFDGLRGRGVSMERT